MKIEKISEKMIYNEQKFTKRVIFNEDRVLNFILNFKPGQRVPAHKLILAPNPSPMYSKEL